MTQVPIERSYWVEPGRFLAGAFPGHPDPQQATERIRAFLAAGIRSFVNLMFEDEVDHEDNLFVPYAPIVTREAARLGVDAQCHRFRIRDVSIPSLERMDEIQSTLRASLNRNQPVYVHCWGGKGRTGQVVGVYLIEQGLATPEDFVHVIAELREADTGGGDSPETLEQIDLVLESVAARGRFTSASAGSGYVTRDREEIEDQR